MANGASVETKLGPTWGGGRQPFGSSYGKLMMWFFLLSDALTFSGFLTAMGLFRFRYEDTWPVAENVFTHFPFLYGEHPLLYVALMTFILIMSSVTMVLAVKAGHELKKDKVILWLGLTVIGGFIFLGSQAWEWYHFIIGDKGAIQLQNGMVVKPVNAEGEVISLSELIKGQPAAHGEHAHFSTESMRAAVKGREGVSFAYPGKTGTTIDREDALDMVATAEVIQGANMRENEYGNVLFADFFFFITGFHGTHVLSGVILNLVVFINVVMGTYERRGHYEMIEKVGLYWHFVDLVWVFVFTFFYLV